MGRMYRALTLSNNGRSVEVVAFVDTGSDGTIISETVATYLQMEFKGQEYIVMPDGGRISSYIGEVNVHSTKDEIDDTIIVDITEVPFLIDPDENIDMIIGVDFLQDHNIKLSFGGE